MNQEKFQIAVQDRVIDGVLHLCGNSAPAVITCHGLFSNKHSEKFVRIAETFSREGFAVVRFDFGGCEKTTGDIADTTVTSRLQALKAVMQILPGMRSCRAGTAYWEVHLAGMWGSCMQPGIRWQRSRYGQRPASCFP